MKETELDHILNYSGGHKDHKKWLRRKIIELVRHASAYKTVRLYSFDTLGEFHRAFKKKYGFKL